jgi:hypothetical protein
LRSGTSIDSDVERALEQALAALEEGEDWEVVAAFVEVACRMARAWPEWPPFPR